MDKIKQSIIQEIERLKTTTTTSQELSLLEDLVTQFVESKKTKKESESREHENSLIEKLSELSTLSKGNTDEVKAMAESIIEAVRELKLNVEAPVVNVEQPKIEVTVPEIKIPTINVPETKLPTINIPKTIFPSLMNISKPTWLPKMPDLSGLTKSLKAIEKSITGFKITRKPSKDYITVRLSNGSKFYEARGGSSSYGTSSSSMAIRDLDSGNTATVNDEGQLHVVQRGKLDTGNSTEADLIANEVFTGVAIDTSDYSSLTIAIESDVASAIDGLLIQYSQDGITWHEGEVYTILAGASKFFTPTLQSKYMKLTYTNGATPTSDFHIHTMLRKQPIKWSSHNIDDPIKGQDDAELMKSVITGKRTDGIFDNVSLTNGSNMKISLEELENVISSNSNTQLNVTNFDITGRHGADLDSKKQHALDEIFSTYGDSVSIQNKKKSILKFGSKITSTTGWETLMSARGSEVEETLLSTNGITTVVSSTTDTHPLKYEYHTISAGALTFGVDEVTLTGTTPVTLPTACARLSRAYNNDGSALTGNVYFYEGGTRTDANTHLIIKSEDQQSQKCATSISDLDYFIITSATLSISSFTTKFASARIEIRPVGKSYWRPITQEFNTTSDTGTIEILFEPHLIVASNMDVRMAVKTNSSGVDVKGGFNGYLAN